MKKTSPRISVFFGLLMLAATQPGCGGNGGMGQALTSAYFPMNVGDMRRMMRTQSGGNVEEFLQTTEAGIDLNGRTVVPFVTRDLMGNVARIDYFGTDNSDSVDICGFDDNETGASSRYEPCLVLPALTTGETQSGSVQVMGTGLLADATSLDFTFRLLNFGSVQIPAGTFSDCASTSVDTDNRDAAGALVEQANFVITLCPGLGVVKISTSLPTGSATSEMVSGTIGGQNFP